MSPEPIRFINTVLRDGHQSLAATRMSTAQMLPVAPLLDRAGFHGLETWGGATIDSCLRFLGENPFDRLRALKQAAPHTPQLMLLRGQNIVQYTSFPDDVVEAFVRASAAAGCDIFRIFDALNDPRNLRTAVRAVITAGRHARGEICYTSSPVHTIEGFARFGEELAAMGCHSLGIKDMSGILAPGPAAGLVRALKTRTGLPVAVHSHDTAGFAAATYLAASAAGADVVETSIAPFANGTGQPDTVRMLDLMEGDPRRPAHFDRALLQEIRGLLEDVYRELAAFTNAANERTDPDILAFQVPGGMLSNFRNQLRELGMADRAAEVMAEVPRVRAALGYIPLVTPTSQIVGTQAMLNVKFGKWKNLAPAVVDIALGAYGRTPGPVDPDLRRLAIEKGGREPIEGRAADALAPRMPALREETRSLGLPDDDETCVLYAMFPQQTIAWHAGERPAPPSSPPPAVAPTKAPPKTPARRFRLTVAGRTEEVSVHEVSP